jgi:hypothetical protein
MNCKEIKKLITAYANGQLSESEIKLMDSHLSGCGNCRRQLEEDRIIGGKLTALQLVSDIPSLPMPEFEKTQCRFWRRRSALALLPLAVLLISLLVLQPWVPDTGPQAVIAKAVNAWGKVQSYRSYHSPGIIIAGTDFYNNSSYGEYVFPDKIHWVFTIEGHESEYIFVGNKEYYRRDDEKSFVIQFPSTPGTHAPDEDDTAEELNSITGVKQLPDETMDGVICYRFTGTDSRNPNCTLDLWIGKDDYLIRQEILRPENPGAEYSYEVNGETRYYKSYTAITEFYDFNEPIDIQPPLDASGNLLPGWRVYEMATDTRSTTTSVSVNDGSTTTTIGFATTSK